VHKIIIFGGLILLAGCIDLASQVNLAFLQKWKETEDQPKIRQNAWERWKSISLPDQQDPEQLPRWLRWEQREKVLLLGSPKMFHSGARRAKSHFPTLTFPKQLEQGQRPSSMGKSLELLPPPLAIYFNPALAADLRKKFYPATMAGKSLQLDHSKTVVEFHNSFPPEVKGAERKIPELDSDSIAIKTIWWPVAGQNWRQHAVPVWRGESKNPVSKDRELVTTWADPILVDTSQAIRVAPKACPESTPYTSSADYSSYQTVPLKDFYYIPIVSCDQVKALVDVSSTFSWVRPGDFIVLMAMHVATREIENWTWSTFWWNPLGSDLEFAKDKPASGIPAPWNNYLMNATLNMTNPTTGVKIRIYSPWLEMLGNRDGVNSNCMSCHRSASYPKLSLAGIPHSGEVRPDSKLLNCRTKLSFLWSLASHTPQKELPGLCRP